MPDNNTGSLGFKLKKARENKGYSLEDIQKITKLRMKYIKAIEENDFSVFSGDVYAKGSIRNYAEIVGLDYKELLDEYNLYYKIDESEEESDAGSETSKDVSAKKEEKQSPGPPLMKKSPGESSIFTAELKRKLIIAFVIILVAAGIWGGYRFIMSIELEAEPGEKKQVVENEKEKNHVKEGEKEPDNDIDLIDEEKEIDDEEVDDELEIEFYTREEGEDWDVYYYVASGTDEMEIEGRVVADRCWLGSFVLDGELNPGMSATYEEGDDFSVTVEEEFEVVIGVPAALEITINDREIDFIGQIEAEGRNVTNPIYLNIVLDEEIDFEA